MQLRIYGESKSLTNDEIRHAVCFFTRALFKDRPRIFNNLSASFIFRPGYKKKEGWKGSLTFEFDTDKPYLKPRHFIFEIDPKYKRPSMLDTIAHECVHLQQYALEKMKDMDQDVTVKWYSKIYRQGVDVSYHRSPWEVEARRKAKILCRAYEKHLRKPL